MLLAALAGQGVDLADAVWASRDETHAAVERWKNEFGAQRYGQLAFVRPQSGVTRVALSPDTNPSWNSALPEPAFVLFQEYADIGLLRCDWSLVADNVARLALADGNGFVAVTENLTAVLLADVDEGNGQTVVAVEAWGIPVDHLRCS